MGNGGAQLEFNLEGEAFMEVAREYATGQEVGGGRQGQERGEEEKAGEEFLQATGGGGGEVGERVEVGEGVGGGKE